MLHSNSKSESYAAAGVDITAGYKAVELMKTHIKRTLTAGAMSDIGGFGGLFELDLTGISKPVLVSGTDGVGTKLKLAFIMDKHDTVGIDCVAMCANDIICCGAKPLLFLDYIACGKNVPERIAEIVSGIAEGCVQSNAALIGGETAEMPGFYPIDEYDLAGFSVGVVDKDKIIDNKKSESNENVTKFVAVLCYLCKQLLFGLNPGNCREIVTYCSKNCIPYSGTKRCIYKEYRQFHLRKTCGCNFLFLTINCN